MKKSISILLVFLFLTSLPLMAADKNLQKIEFWRLFESENYRQAFPLSVTIAAKSPGYYYLSFYLYSIIYKNGDTLKIIEDDIGYITNRDIEELETDINWYGETNSVPLLLSRAIIAYNDKKNPRESIELVKKANNLKKTLLGIYLLSTFSERDDAQQARNQFLQEKPDAGYARLLYYYNAVNQRKAPDELRKILLELLSTSGFVFTVEDYRNIIRVGIGEKFISAIGPGGPGGEPYFGPLYSIRDWEAVRRFHPDHQVMLGYSLAVGGGQNTADAEKAFSLLPAGTAAAYAPLLAIARVYECFHEYKYDEACRLAEGLLKQNLNAEDYFTPIYDLGYQFEMFYVKWKKDPRFIDIAIRLYKQADTYNPKWSRAFSTYVLLSYGRSQYYGGKYNESIVTLKQCLPIMDFPLCFVFLSLDYYKLGNKEEGSYWEKRTRDAFKESSQTLYEYEKLLAEAKKV